MLESRMLKALKGQPPICLSPLKEERVFQQFSVNVSLVCSVLQSLYLNSHRASKHPSGFTLCVALRIVFSSYFLIILWLLYSLFYSRICKFRILLIFFLLSIRSCGYLLPFCSLCVTKTISMRQYCLLSPYFAVMYFLYIYIKHAVLWLPKYTLP